jgi:hypothetical protein
MTNSKIKCFFGNEGSTTAECIQAAIFFFFEGEECDRNCRGYGMSRECHLNVTNVKKIIFQSSNFIDSNYISIDN